MADCDYTSSPNIPRIKETEIEDNGKTFSLLAQLICRWRLERIRENPKDCGTLYILYMKASDYLDKIDRESGASGDKTARYRNSGRAILLAQPLRRGRRRSKESWSSYFVLSFSSFCHSISSCGSYIEFCTQKRERELCGLYDLLYLLPSRFFARARARERETVAKGNWIS